MEALTARGHTAYSFLSNDANLVTGESAIEKSEEDFPSSIADWENDPAVKQIFESDMQALKESDTVILLEPSGGVPGKSCTSGGEANWYERSLKWDEERSIRRNRS